MNFSEFLRVKRQSGARGQIVFHSRRIIVRRCNRIHQRGAKFVAKCHIICVSQEIICLIISTLFANFTVSIPSTGCPRSPWISKPGSTLTDRCFLFDELSLDVLVIRPEVDCFC